MIWRQEEEEQQQQTTTELLVGPLSRARGQKSFCLESGGLKSEVNRDDSKQVVESGVYRIDRFRLNQNPPSPFSSFTKHAHSLPLFSQNGIGLLRAENAWNGHSTRFEVSLENNNKQLFTSLDNADFLDTMVRTYLDFLRIEASPWKKTTPLCYLSWETAVRFCFSRRLQISSIVQTVHLSMITILLRGWLDQLRSSGLE